jgi:hypothetical protein
MSSQIRCPKGHSTKAISFQDAAVALSAGRSIGVCKKCGQEYEYTVDYVYPNDPNEKEYSFVVTRTVRLAAKPTGDKKLDSFLLVLRDIKTGKEHVLPTFWAFGHTGIHRGGHPAPILSLEEWKRLFRQLDSGFEEPLQKIRLRAYELYEKRGKLDGYDMEDWLQAEAEIVGRTELLVAA